MAGRRPRPSLANVRVLAINTRLGETGTTGGPDDGSATPPPIRRRKSLPTPRSRRSSSIQPRARQSSTATQLGKLSLALRSIVDFKANPVTRSAVPRNAPIKLIRYGQEANVMAGTSGGNSGGSRRWCFR